MSTPASRPRRSERSQSPLRLEAYTDGVFAIAATLLVLNLSIDEIGEVSSSDALWRGLEHLVPATVSFVVSFLLLGLLWTIHVHQFEYIDSVDNTMMWLNTTRLLGVVFVPFATSMSSAYSDYLVGRMVLPVTFLFVITLGTLQWFYATNPSRHLVRANVDPRVIDDNRTGGIVAVITGILVVALSSVAGSYAFLLFACGPPVTVLLRRLGVPRKSARVVERS